MYGPVGVFVVGVWISPWNESCHMCITRLFRKETSEQKCVLVGPMGEIGISKKVLDSLRWVDLASSNFLNKKCMAFVFLRDCERLCGMCDVRIETVEFRSDVEEVCLSKKNDYQKTHVWKCL
jgi:hypothetical protein